MKKLLFLGIFFLVFSFALAQNVQVDPNLLRQIVDILQKIIQGGQIQQVPQQAVPPPQPTQEKSEKEIKEAPSLIPAIPLLVAPLPRGVKPAIPQVQEAKPITPEVLKSILPDKDRKDDAIIQINNLRITRILNNPGLQGVKAIFFAVRDTGWKCLMFESEESKKPASPSQSGPASPSQGRSMPCILNLRKPILQRELAIQVSNDTILLLRNRQKAKLDDFQVGDKINVYGFMDKSTYGIDALIVRRIVSAPKPIETKPVSKCGGIAGFPCPSGYECVYENGSTVPPYPDAMGVCKPTFRIEPKPFCVQVITPAYNPQTGECKEFPTPCDVPQGWVRTDKCQTYEEIRNRDNQRVSDLRILANYLTLYFVQKGEFPSAPDTSDSWSNLKNAFSSAALSFDLPTPPNGDPYLYIPCSDTSSVTNHFVLRARLEQSKKQAPSIYELTYDLANPPSGWSCTNWPTDGCTASNRYFCLIQ